jgi:hypothetical protein
MFIDEGARALVCRALAGHGKNAVHILSS